VLLLLLLDAAAGFLSLSKEVYSTSSDKSLAARRSNLVFFWFEGLFPAPCIQDETQNDGIHGSYGCNRSIGEGEMLDADQKGCDGYDS